MKNKKNLKINLILSCLCFLCLFPKNLFAEIPQIKEEELKEREVIFNTLRVSGMGGAGSSTPIDFEPLLYNPAGLTSKLQNRSKGFTFSLGVDTYFKPQYLIPIIENISSNMLTSTILFNTKELITSSGAGAAATFALGFTPVKKSFGIGLYGGGTVYISGKPFPLGTQGYINLSITFPLAYSWILSESSKNKLSFGVNLHPEIAIFRTLNGSDVDALAGGTVTVNQLINQVINNPYFSLPLDLGIIYTAYNVPYKNAEMRISSTINNLFGNFFGPGTKNQVVKKEILINFGTALILPFEIFNLDFTGILSAETKGFNQVVEEKISFWKSTRFGAELDIENFLFLRAGLTSGYPAVSAELRVFHFYFGFSWQTIEKGLYIGDNPLSVFRFSLSIH